MSQQDRPITRIARGLAGLIAECNEAQHRWLDRVMDPEEYVFPCNKVPGSYAEFLARTSGPLPHEPSARDRSAGA